MPAHSLAAARGVRVLISIENSDGHEHPRSMNYGKRVSTRCRCPTGVPARDAHPTADGGVHVLARDVLIEADFEGVVCGVDDTTDRLSLNRYGSPDRMGMAATRRAPVWRVRNCPPSSEGTAKQRLCRSSQNWRRSVVAPFRRNGQGAISGIDAGTGRHKRASRSGTPPLSTAVAHIRQTHSQTANRWRSKAPRGANKTSRFVGITAKNLSE